MTNLLEERLRRSNITIRKINIKNYGEETAKLQEVYNKAWDENMGFVNMTREEFNCMSKEMKQILNSDFYLIAKHKVK